MFILSGTSLKSRGFAWKALFFRETLSSILPHHVRLQHNIQVTEEGDEDEDEAKEVYFVPQDPESCKSSLERLAVFLVYFYSLA